jgi:ribosomal protein L28
MRGSLMTEVAEQLVLRRRRLSVPSHCLAAVVEASSHTSGHSMRRFSSGCCIGRVWKVATQRKGRLRQNARALRAGRIGPRCSGPCHTQRKQPPWESPIEDGHWQLATSKPWHGRTFHPVAPILS